MDISSTAIRFIINLIPVLSLGYFIVGIIFLQKKYKETYVSFSLLMFASAVYSFGYFLEINSTDFAIGSFVRTFEYLGVSFIPTFGILFILQLTNENKSNSKVSNILTLVSLILWLLYVSNPYHHLFYRSFDLYVGPYITSAITVKGPFYYALLLYYIGFAVYSIALMHKSSQKADIRPAKRKSARFLFFTFQIIWLPVFIILFGFDKYIDPTPFSIMLISCLFLVNEIKNDMFEIQLNRWKNEYSTSIYPAMLMDASGILCVNTAADDLLHQYGMDADSLIADIVKNERSIEPVMLTDKDEAKWFHVTKQVFDRKKDLVYYSLVDITERKRMEQQLFKEKERFKITLISVGDGVISTDTQGNVMIMNKISEQLTGWTQEEATGKPIEEVFHIVNEATREKCKNPVHKVLETGNSMELANHILLIAKDGTERPIEDSTAPIIDDQGNIAGVVLVFRDFTQKKKDLEKIQYLSFHDHLTGLYNRRYFEAELKRLDTQRNWPLTIVVGDVNGLKLINDSFGHAKGDELLKKTAEAIKNSCREDDIIARIGGDEFSVLLPKTEGSQAAQLIKRIKSHLKKEGQGDLEISIALGYGTKTIEADDIDGILKKAEDNMYNNKLFEGPGVRASMIDNIMATINEKSPLEKVHSERVAQICTAIGEALKLDKNEIKKLKTFGLLHDIGKIAIAEDILNKTGVLTQQEFAEIKRHAEIGYRILSTVNDISDIAVYVLAQHERLDGTGYPKGLAGEAIPLFSRICAIADAYDTMTSTNSYKPAMSRELAAEELQKNAGIQFDAELVDVFLIKVLPKLSNG